MVHVMPRGMTDSVALDSLEGLLMGCARWCVFFACLTAPFPGKEHTVFKHFLFLLHEQTYYNGGLFIGGSYKDYIY